MIGKNTAKLKELNSMSKYAGLVDVVAQGSESDAAEAVLFREVFYFYYCTHKLVVTFSLSFGELVPTIREGRGEAIFRLGGGPLSLFFPPRRITKKVKEKPIPPVGGRFSEPAIEEVLGL